MNTRIFLLILFFALVVVMPATAVDEQASDELLSNDEMDINVPWLDEPENETSDELPPGDNDELTSLWFDSTFVDNQVTFAGGSGTSDDPYLVENAAQLNKTRDDLTAHYRQIADIDLAGWSGGAGWNPIGYGDYNKFRGTYDGAGFSIINLTINRPGSYAQGLFGQMDGATIRAVNLKDVSVHGGFGTGALIGSMSSGTVDSVTVTGTIRGETGAVGGLVGHQGGGTIQNAAVHADVQGTTDVGGLVGSGGTQIRHSYTEGSVSGTQRVGGLVGNLGHGTISDTYSRASVEGTDYVGGLIGRTEGWLGKVSRSYSTGPVNGTGTNVGGFQGGGTNNTQFCFWDTEASGQSTSFGGEGVAGKTTAEMQRQASYPAFNFYSLWTINEGDDYPIFQDLDRFDYTPLPDVNLDDLSGSGTPDDPYIITSAAELNAMRKDMTAHYRLNRDLDLSNSLVWNGGLGWAQIGSYNQRFRGSFDGGGHTITNLTINRPYHHNDAGTGLIGGTEGATVHSIHLRNVAIQGDSRTGALIGDATSGTIRNTTVSGQVVTLSTMTGGLIGSLSGTLEQASGEVSVIGGQETGGLVGRQAGGTIQNARVFADVQGATQVGGLVGSAGTQIRHSYAEGSVNGTENVGGLVGSLGHSTISDSYSRVSVEGTDYIGGFIGKTEGWLGRVSRSYSAGSVTGTGTNVGGFQGGGTNNTQFCSWDTEASGLSTSWGGEGVAGKTTAEMQKQASYPAFNFYSLWTINEGDDYPIFQDLDRFDYTPLPDVNLDDLSGSGTPDDPYIITSAADLNAMRKNMTAYYRLNRDLDLTNSLVWNGGLGWAQIGSNTQRFRGGFDGGGHTITNLTINRPYHYNDAGTGLIGAAEGATIHSIHLRNVAVHGDSGTGSLVGEASSCTIRNTTVSGQVVSSNIRVNTGGMLGYLSGTLEEASGEVSVIGAERTGGLVGFHQGGTITNCSVYATVQGTNDVGGLIGSGSGTNSRLYSNGTVIGVEDVGGLLGEWSGGTLSDTYSRATVNGTTGVGGLAGRISWTGAITRSYSTGAVNGTDQNIGGLLGAGSAITSSYWDIDTSGQSTSAGGAGAMGRNTADMTYPYAADTYVDWDFGTGWAADTDYSKNDGYPYFDTTPPVPIIEVRVLPETSSLEVGETGEYQVILSQLPDGLGSFDIDINLTEPGIARITRLNITEGTGNYSALPAESVSCWSNTHIPLETENSTIVTISIEALTEGTTNLTVTRAALWPKYETVTIPAEIRIGSSIPPVANFTANRTLGSAPLAVAFTDLSTGNPTSWSWQFGDGTNSTDTNPVHIYTQPDTYTVQLRVENSAGGSTMIWDDYITVLPQASDMIIRAGSLNVATGMTGAIPVSITNVTRAEEIICSVTVNPVYANFTGVAVNASVAGGTNLTYQINNQTGTLDVTITRINGNYTTGDEPLQILDITLQAKHQVGESQIDFGDAMWIRNDVEIPFGSKEAGILNIHLRCDFNRNNRIDIGDVAKVAWMAAGLVEEDLEADFDGDGHGTGADAARIAYYYVGKIGEL